MMKVLVVDDDVTVHQLISAIIQVIGDIEVESSFNGREALERARLEPPDLIISDVSMPDLDGLTLTRMVRETPALSNTAVLLLTARGDTQDKYHGFLHGADDYLIKPFDATELQLRIKALLRRAARTTTPTANPLAAGPLELNPHRYMAKVGEAEVRLTASEFAILKYLVSHADQVVAVESLLVEALDYPSRTGNPQVIHTHVKNIRAKLREAGVEPGFLSSSRRGYMIDTTET